MLHEFHFVVSNEIYQKLKKFSKRESNPMSLSATIVYIFKQMNAFLEMKHLISLEKNSRYGLIALPIKKRAHVYCYLPEELYRKLKLIHQDLNVYSLAQILRKMIVFFLKGYLKYGGKKLNTRLNDVKKRWEEKKIAYRKKNETFIRQLSYITKGIYYCRSIYGLDFRPYQIQFLE